MTRHDSSVDDPLILRAGGLQRYLAKREEYVAEAYLTDVRVIETQIDASAPVAFRGVLSTTHNGVVVRGTLSATWIAPCRRCNAEIRTQTAWEFLEMFATDPTEGESYPLGDEALDLRAMVRDQAILQLPLAPVCKDDCNGICSNCGADLNANPCPCGAEATDPRWDALRDLKLDE